MLLTTDKSTSFYTDEGCHIIEILNSANYEKLSIAQARVEVGVRTQLHAVAADEIYYVLQGQGEAEIDGQGAVLGPGDGVLIHEGQSQCITNIGEIDLVFLCICTPRFRPEGYRVV